MSKKQSRSPTKDEEQSRDNGFVLCAACQRGPTELCGTSDGVHRNDEGLVLHGENVLRQAFMNVEVLSVADKNIDTVKCNKCKTQIGQRSIGGVALQLHERKIFYKSDIPYYLDPQDFLSSQSKLALPNKQDWKTFLRPSLNYPYMLKYSQVRGMCHGVMENTVICLPTGEGKTQVAAEIMRLLKELNPTKIPLMIVDKVPLTHEQREKLEEGSGLKEILALNGGTKDKRAVWNQVRSGTCEALVATAGLLENDHFFYNQVAKGKISALIFDECHNTRKNHPYAKILERVSEFGLADPTRLRIVGLTATPEDLKGTLSDILELMSYKECSPYFFAPPLDQYRTDRVTHKYVPIEILPEQRLAFDKLCDKLRDKYPELGETLKGSYEEVLLGSQSTASRRAGYGGIVGEIRSKLEASSGGKRELYERALEDIKKLAVIDTFGVKSSTTEDFMTADSPRVEEFFKIITEELIKGERGTAKMIVFTDNRDTAWDLKRVTNDRFREINADVIVGHGGDDGQNWFTRNGQRDRLNKFKDNKCRILISTSVLQEGIDVATCNCVVAFSGVSQSFIALQQSAGRARDEDAKLYLIATEHERGRYNKQKKECVEAQDLVKGRFLNQPINTGLTEVAKAIREHIEESYASCVATTYDLVIAFYHTPGDNSSSDITSFLEASCIVNNLCTYPSDEFSWNLLHGTCVTEVSILHNTADVESCARSIFSTLSKAEWKMNETEIACFRVLNKFDPQTLEERAWLHMHSLSQRLFVNVLNPFEVQYSKKELSHCGETRFVVCDLDNNRGLFATGAKTAMYWAPGQDVLPYLLFYSSQHNLPCFYQRLDYKETEEGPPDTSKESFALQAAVWSFDNQNDFAIPVEFWQQVADMLHYPEKSRRLPIVLDLLRLSWGVGAAGPEVPGARVSGAMWPGSVLAADLVDLMELDGQDAVPVLHLDRTSKGEYHVAPPRFSLAPYRTSREGNVVVYCSSQDEVEKSFELPWKKGQWFKQRATDTVRDRSVVIYNADELGFVQVQATMGPLQRWSMNRRTAAKLGVAEWVSAAPVGFYDEKFRCTKAVEVLVLNNQTEDLIGREEGCMRLGTVRAEPEGDKDRSMLELWEAVKNGEPLLHQLRAVAAASPLHSGRDNDIMSDFWFDNLRKVKQPLKNTVLYATYDSTGTLPMGTVRVTGDYWERVIPSGAHGVLSDTGYESDYQKVEIKTGKHKNMDVENLIIVSRDIRLSADIVECKLTWEGVCQPSNASTRFVKWSVLLEHQLRALQAVYGTTTLREIICCELPSWTEVMDLHGKLKTITAKGLPEVGNTFSCPYERLGAEIQNGQRVPLEVKQERDLACLGAIDKVLTQPYEVVSYNEGNVEVVCQEYKQISSTICYTKLVQGTDRTTIDVDGIRVSVTHRSPNRDERMLSDIHKFLDADDTMVAKHLWLLLPYAGTNIGQQCEFINLVKRHYKKPLGYAAVDTVVDCIKKPAKFPDQDYKELLRCILRGDQLPLLPVTGFAPCGQFRPCAVVLNKYNLNLIQRTVCRRFNAILELKLNGQEVKYQLLEQVNSKVNECLRYLQSEVDRKQAKRAGVVLWDADKTALVKFRRPEAAKEPGFVAVIEHVVGIGEMTSFYDKIVGLQFTASCKVTLSIGKMFFMDKTNGISYSLTPALYAAGLIQNALDYSCADICVKWVPTAQDEPASVDGLRPIYTLLVIVSDSPEVSQVCVTFYDSDDTTGGSWDERCGAIYDEVEEAVQRINSE